MVPWAVVNALLPLQSSISFEVLNGRKQFDSKKSYKSRYEWYQYKLLNQSRRNQNQKRQAFEKSLNKRQKCHYSTFKFHHWLVNCNYLFYSSIELLLQSSNIFIVVSWYLYSSSDQLHTPMLHHPTATIADALANLRRQRTSSTHTKQMAFKLCIHQRYLVISFI